MHNVRRCIASPPCPVDARWIRVRSANGNDDTAYFNFSGKSGANLRLRSNGDGKRRVARQREPLIPNETENGGIKGVARKEGREGKEGVKIVVDPAIRRLACMAGPID